jgi:hypothetical protein
MTSIPFRWEDSDHAVETWYALQQLGFHPEEGSFGCPSMSYDFSGFRLQATRLMNLQMRNMVSFSGVYRTPRTIGSIEFDMPLRIESMEQCAAWIAWHLNRNLPRREPIISESRSELLVFGLKHQETLPWERARVIREREAEEYRRRPACIVDRAMLKLGLRTLAKYIEQATDSDWLDICFDGQALMLQINGKRIILQAEGSPWESHFVLPAGKLREMPKRLLRDAVDVSIWREQLQIDRSRYDGVVEHRREANCPA